MQFIFAGKAHPRGQRGQGPDPAAVPVRQPARGAATDSSSSKTTTCTWPGTWCRARTSG
ncbi:MAG: hypothetical protein MZV70_56315 [Desulfobacterales bacterium]|nr:hypothetical protein [Desulfobacterales bacterium]